MFNPLLFFFHGPSELSWEGINLSMEDTTSILPRLKRNSNAYGIGALANASLSGVSGVSRTMKERVTKPTGMAQGRVAHMIEWQNWGMSTVGPGGVPLPRITTEEREKERRLESDAYSDLSEGEKEARFTAGILQQFAVTEATLIAWGSMDGESTRSGSMMGSVARLSEVNQESITSRDQILHHSSAEVWPHTYVSQGHYCLSSSDAWEPMNKDSSGVMSSPAGSYVLGPEGYEGQASLEQRLHSANQSLQATPNSTIHSLVHPARPPLVDLWNSMEAYPTESGGFMGVAVMEDEMRVCMEPELASLTPPRHQGDASGGSSPGQPPAEPITERKSSDVSSSLVQTLEKEEEEALSPGAAMTAN
ncbi:hypothetical protein JOQ06_024970 [Pogonophryne albipinna]|uniref:Family with sequence similarity 131 member Bb n=1 Tax=Pogonophryne albipinna TaxID=1090488 RepID=A0AAD6ATT7_9TELE|nr:hypothetical protein JOQ06_024970 [Pogonophryne albipinna]